MTSPAAHDGLPTIVAHRGDPTSWPENTRPAVAAAVEAGATAIEIDVQLAADRVPVLMHDEDLRRTCGVTGTASALTADELASLGTLGAPGDTARVPVPRLAEVVEDLRETAVELFVEIKRAAVARFGVETVVDRVAAELVPLGPRAVVISFEEAIVARARDAHGLATGWIVRGDDDAHMARAAALAPDVLVCRVDRIGATPLRAGPWRWMVYTVDDPERVLAWGRRGADLVETDQVSTLLRDPRFGGKAARHG